MEMKMNRLRNSVWRLALCAQLIFGLTYAVSAYSAEQIQVCFSPPPRGGCDPTATVVQNIDRARKRVLVQAYALTSREITTALVDAKHRGVDVRVIVDRSQMHEDRSDAFEVQRLASDGVPVWVDTISGIAHSKVMIIDGDTVITGSFNFTWSAEHKNVENLLVIRDPSIALQFGQNWEGRVHRSRPLGASAGPAPDEDSHREPNASSGTVVGNLKSKIYAWPGCANFDKMSPSNRVEFPSREAAEQAGYKAARNCP
jgi:phosphatidylserine/phosphatidylglycerophosphate/cardiolipin synthase-like enzyme